ncbi:Uncharacterized protein TCM_010192 [Theobroma cacao]|uniref:Uncharacterized protein n=1 Tax=Theobroma cacao TaxID=3641 RepID=A0A061E5P7_THECC|nr:Uncharacterized protein TCM_010192 [Theobroma cacao]
MDTDTMEKRPMVNANGDANGHANVDAVVMDGGLEDQIVSRLIDRYEGNGTRVDLNEADNINQAIALAPSSLPATSIKDHPTNSPTTSSLHLALISTPPEATQHCQSTYSPQAPPPPQVEEELHPMSSPTTTFLHPTRVPNPLEALKHDQITLSLEATLPPQVEDARLSKEMRPPPIDKTFKPTEMVLPKHVLEYTSGGSPLWGLPWHKACNTMPALVDIERTSQVDMALREWGVVIM